jgi:hypothetical protein
MDLNSRAFTEAVKALNDVGLLDPQKLAVRPVSSLKDIAELAIDGWEHQISKDQMLTWLKMERNKAIPKHQMLQEESTKYEELHRYRLNLEGTKIGSEKSDIRKPSEMPRTKDGASSGSRLDWPILKGPTDPCPRPEIGRRSKQSKMGHSVPESSHRRRLGPAGG